MKTDTTERIEVNLATEQDIERLRSAALWLAEQVDTLRRHIKSLKQQIDELKAQGASTTELEQQLKQTQEQLDVLRSTVFEPSSEKSSNNNTEKKPREKQRGHGPKEQPHLAKEERVHELDEADKSCPQCGGKLEPIKGQFEESEQIDIHPRVFVVVVHKRQKYRCRCGSCIETAPGPLKHIDGGRYSMRFAVDAAVSKYEEHLPLERQARRMRHDGLDISTQTLWDQIETLATINTPLVERLHARVLLEPVVGMDETRWKILSKRGVSDEKNKSWQVWVMCSPRFVFYKIKDARNIDAAKSVLKNFRGGLVTDGYQVYVSIAKETKGIINMFCWAHVRREFIDARKRYPESQQYIDLINTLFELEKIAGVGDDEDTLALRYKVRREQSRPVLGDIFRLARKSTALDTSLLGKAILYMMKLRRGLVRFINNPRAPIHNNASERALRDPVLGRKNHYGSKSERGTEVAAIMYTLIENASLHNIDPKAYLLYSTATHLLKNKPLLPHELTQTTLQNELEMLSPYL